MEQSTAVPRQPPALGISCWFGPGPRSTQKIKVHKPEVGTVSASRYGLLWYPWVFRAFVHSLGVLPCCKLETQTCGLVSIVCHSKQCSHQQRGQKQFYRQKQQCWCAFFTKDVPYFGGAQLCCSSLPWCQFAACPHCFRAKIIL